MPRHVDSRRVYLLMFNACGSGGVARTVLNLANHLADNHEVEVISVLRRRDEPRFAVDPRVRLSYLEDRRPTRPNQGRLRTMLRRRRSRLQPPPVDGQMSLLSDLLLYRKLRGLRTGILISTRPSLHLAAARFAPSRLVTIGQDHLNFPSRFANEKQAAVLRATIPKLDSYTVLTEADAVDYRRELPDVDTDIGVIRNALPWPVPSTPAKLDSKIVLAAGRLSREKGFRRLVHAFAPIAREHPDWQLHIYGHGEEREHLSAMIARKRLDKQIVLKGFAADFPSVLADASVYAMSSFSEGFPMVLIEAMSTGLPLVSFDCPRGPGEIVDDGKNGRLVDDGDILGFTEALRSVIEDDDLRYRLGAQAHEDARKYEVDHVVAQWEDLFARTLERRRG